MNESNNGTRRITGALHRNISIAGGCETKNAAGACHLSLSEDTIQYFPSRFLASTHVVSSSVEMSYNS